MDTNGSVNYSAHLRTDGLRQDADRAKQILHGIGGTATTEGTKIDTAMRNIGAGIAGVFTVQKLAQFATAVVNVRGKFQELEVSFNTMLGSKAKADALMQQLVHTAAITPFSLEEVSDSAKQLLAYGEAADQVNDTLTRLGDIAAGLNLRMSDLAWLYGTTMVQGRLFSRDLYQFTNRGIPLTDELAKIMGVTKDQVSALVSEGKVGFPQVKAAIEDLTNSGGKFYNLMAEQSKTVTGQISNLKDSFQVMLNEIGKRAQPIIEDGIKLAQELMDNWESVGKAILLVVETVGVYKGAMIAITVVTQIVERTVKIWETLRTAINAASAAQAVFNAVSTKNLWAGLISLVVSAATAFMMFRHRTDDASTSVGKFGKAATDTANRVNMLANEINSLDKGSAAYGSAMKELNGILRQYGLETLKEGASMREVNDARAEAINLIEKEGLAQQHLNEIKAATDKANKSEEGAYNSLSKSLGTEKAAPSNPLIHKATQEIAKQAEGIGIVIQNVVNDNLKEIAGKEGDAYKSGIAVIDQRLREALRNYQLSGEAINYLSEQLTNGNGALAQYAQRVARAHVELDNFTDQQNRAYRATARATDATLTEAQSLKTTQAEILKCANDTNALKIQIQQLLDRYAHNLIQFDVVFNGQLPSWITSKSKGQTLQAMTAYSAALKSKGTKFKVGGGVDVGRAEIATRLTQLTAHLRDLNDEQARQAQLSQVSVPEIKTPSGGSSSSVDDAKERAERAKEEAEQLAEAHAERMGQEAEYADQLAKQQREQALTLSQQRVDLEKDSSAKELDQLAVNHRRALAQIKDEADEMVRALAEQQQRVWLDQNPKATQLQQQQHLYGLLHGSGRLTEADLSSDQRAYLGNRRDNENQIYKLQQIQYYRESLKDFESYEQQREDIAREYAEKLKEIQTSGLGDTEGMTEMLDKWRDNANRQIDEAEAEAAQKATPFFTRLFGDIDDMSYNELSKLRSRGEQLMSMLQAKDYKGLMSDFGIGKEQADALNNAPDKLQAIREQLQKVTQQAEHLNPFKELAVAVQDVFNPKTPEAKKMSTAAKLRELGQAAADTADTIGGLADSLSQMFRDMGNNTLGDISSTVGDVMKSVSAIGKGFASGGPIGGIIAAAGQAISWIGKAFSSAARHRAELRKIEQESVAETQAYTLAVLEQNRAMKQASTVFGNLDYRKAVNSVNVMKDAWQDLRNAIDGATVAGHKYDSLADVRIKTGHKHHFLGIGDHDVYTAITKVYPGLIDAQGNFNEALAKSILETREFKGNGKEALQNMINLYDEATKASDDVRNYLSGIFGDLGQNMSDALVDAFRNGSDAADAFGKSVTQMLEKISSQMIFEDMFGKTIENANKRMQKVMNDTTLDDQSKMQQYIDILSAMTDSILSQKDNFEDMLKRVRQMGADKGLDMFKADDTSKKQGTQGGIQSVSQDSVDELNGRITVMQTHTYNIAADTKTLVGTSASILRTLMSIETSTRDLPTTLTAMEADLRAVRQGVGDLTTKGIKMRS